MHWLRHRDRHRFPLLPAVALLSGAVLSGCGSLGGADSDPSVASASTDTSMVGRFSNFFSRTPQRVATAGPAGPNTEIECPQMTVRSGAATLTVNGPGAEPGATAVRYQATLGQMARECSALGQTMTMKVGVQGRVILGPAGGPGQIEIPLRYAVVQEGPEPKTILTKLERIPVAIAAGQSNVAFTHIEEAMSFPLPKGSELDAYVVYVGFDPLAKDERRQKPRRGR